MSSPTALREDDFLQVADHMDGIGSTAEDVLLAGQFQCQNGT
jgi:hypothetical protein